jgi:hypothetical protein
VPSSHRLFLTRGRRSLRSEFLGGLTEREEQSAIADDTKTHTIVRTSRLHVHNRPRLTAIIASDALVGFEVYQHSHNLPLSYLKKLADRSLTSPELIHEQLIDRQHSKGKRI